MNLLEIINTLKISDERPIVIKVFSGHNATTHRVNSGNLLDVVTNNAKQFVADNPDWCMLPNNTNNSIVINDLHFDYSEKAFYVSFKVNTIYDDGFIDTFYPSVYVSIY